ncbi:unnamed protein product [Effrenium voratum]|nr:unnamed protein product [Effrenium voratum]
MADLASLHALWDASCVRLRELDGYGCGMVCTEDVQKGGVLLTLPLDVCWTAATARRVLAHSAVDAELLEAISDATAIVLHMLMEIKGPDGFRKQHMAFLQRSKVETLLDWSAAELKRLQGSKWPMVCEALRQDILSEYQELSEILEDLFQAFEITAEKFLWAHKVLLSRMVAFLREGGSRPLVLGPGQDMFNHSHEAVGSEDVVLEEREGSEVLVVRAFKDFKAGEQAFYSYSPASNGRLLLMGGFTLPDNPFDSVELVLTFPVTAYSAPLFEQLAAGLQSVRKPGAVVMEETEDEFLAMGEESTEATEASLHVLDELSRCNPHLTSELVAASDGDVAARRRNLERLRGFLEQMAAQYERPLEDDEAALATSPSLREVQALQVLIGEKRIFRKALRLLDEKLGCSYSTSLGGRGLWQGLGLRGVLTGALATAVARRSRRGLNFGARRLASVSASKREYDFDLFTIGGGSGGVRGSRWAAMQYGAKVALAELPFAIVSTKHEAGGLGGTCVIRGCVPKKLLIYGSHLREDIQDGRGYGWSLPEGVSPSLDWDKLIEAKNAEA